MKPNKLAQTKDILATKMIAEIERICERSDIVMHVDGIRFETRSYKITQTEEVWIWGLNPNFPGAIQIFHAGDEFRNFLASECSLNFLSALLQKCLAEVAKYRG